MQRPRNLVAAGLLLTSLALVGHSVLDRGGWPRRTRAAQDLAALQRDNAAHALRVDELRARVQALRSRAEVQERIARDELGYVRDGDFVLELP